MCFLSHLTHVTTIRLREERKNRYTGEGRYLNAVLNFSSLLNSDQAVPFFLFANPLLYPVMGFLYNFLLPPQNELFNVYWFIWVAGTLHINSKPFLFLYSQYCPFGPLCSLGFCSRSQYVYRPPEWKLLFWCCLFITSSSVPFLWRSNR